MALGYTNSKNSMVLLIRRIQLENCNPNGNSKEAHHITKRSGKCREKHEWGSLEMGH